MPQLRAIPGIRLYPESAEPDQQLDLAAELRLTSFLRPLNSSHPEAVTTALLASLGRLNPAEIAAMQLVVAPAAPRQLIPPPEPGSRNRRPSIASEFLAVRRALTQEQYRAAREKTSSSTFLIAIRIGIKAGTQRRRRQLLRQLLGVFHVVNAPGVHFKKRLAPNFLTRLRMAQGDVPLLSFPAILNVRELVALAAFPIGSPQIPGLQLGGAKQLPPSVDIPTEGRVLATANYPGATRPLAVSVPDSLRHIHAIGPTGTGKSTELLNLITQDMSQGFGVAAIDPKGDLIADVLERVPASRVEDVIVLDPTDSERPVGLNLLAGSVEYRELVVEQVVTIFHHLYSAFWGPRTDDVLRATLLTLIHEPGMTLTEVPLLLTDSAFRQRLVGQIDDPIALEPFWSWFENLSAGERAQIIGPVLNKLRAILLRRRLVNVIGQARPTFDMDMVLAERKILLVSLSKGLLGDDAAALLGSLVLARLWQAVQRRASLRPEDRHPFFCHIDEFQDYLNLPMAIEDVLAQARGYAFGLTLAHQHLGQLPPTTRQAVLANARTKVVFQTAAGDARVLAREFAPYLDAEDLQGLGPFEVYIAISAGFRVAPVASAVTLPSPPKTSRAAVVRAASRTRYGRQRSEIDREIRARHGERKGTGPIGVRRRS